MTERTMWAVKDSDGAIDIATIKPTRDEAINAFVNDVDHWYWRMQYAAGYRCVRVTVREVDHA